jgi:hypothetical protein
MSPDRPYRVWQIEVLGGYTSMRERAQEVETWAKNVKSDIESENKSEDINIRSMAEAPERGRFGEKVRIPRGLQFRAAVTAMAHLMSPIELGTKTDIAKEIMRHKTPDMARKRDANLRADKLRAHQRLTADPQQFKSNRWQFERFTKTGV